VKAFLGFALVAVAPEVLSAIELQAGMVNGWEEYFRLADLRTKV
jgi:hypothetical protein